VRRIVSSAGLDPGRFPVDPWRLVETEFNGDDLGVTETLFAIGNGYIGMRANPTEGREAHTHGTYLNGFHETWDITYAEDAVAFAKRGQTIVNVPDAKLIKLYVDDEPLLISTADLERYERSVDFRTGVSSRDALWRTPAGKRIWVRSARMVSLHHRHLAMMIFEFRMLDSPAPVVVSSQLMNRQDGQDEYYVRAAALGEGRDPRQSRRFGDRVLMPRLQRHHEDPATGGEVLLGYRCARSGMTLACGYEHAIQANCAHTIETSVGPDLAKTVFTIEALPGETVRIVKYVAYHSSTGVPPEELADRCHRTLARARSEGVDQLLASQKAWLDEYWAISDIEVRGDDAAQQAVRFNLFQLAQASARTQEQGIPAKGVTGGGYDGHYFWDTEVYVVPFLAYTNPEIARKVLRFRWRMLPAARSRAAELSQRGALYPWRTINGEEASAYYAAGTAQYHINAAIAFALERYLNATGDVDFLSDEGAELMVETARLWEDLGFYATDEDQSFHIHSVTGPDEYTTVVNDNAYTNMMARFNLRFAAKSVDLLAEWDPTAYERLRRRTGLEAGEIESWRRAAHAMYIPYDEELGIHPQDATFLERERWDFENTPSDKYPLLLHYHPLVIYRFQVLKQADVVLAMYMRGDQFSRDQKRRNFDYYDPITTGDSSLSACVQAIVAAEVGHDELALEYFRQALYLDLLNLHGNTPDGIHVASCGGMWAGIVHGFAGMVDNGEWLRFEPRLPAVWEGLTFRILRHGCRVRVDVDPDGCTVTAECEPGVPIQTGEGVIRLEPGEQVRIPRPEATATGFGPGARSTA
jgi:alpha,alpha-trehalose phosphorylase